jgi:hypothetical protein
MDFEGSSAISSRRDRVSVTNDFAHLDKIFRDYHFIGKLSNLEKVHIPLATFLHRANSSAPV